MANADPIMSRRSDRPLVEWPTLAVIAGCYSVWALAIFWLPSVSLTLAVVAAALAIALHSSATHEVIHGHPFRNARLNMALVYPALTILIPFHRFRDTHLAHHMDARLTDPYDDPESNFWDSEVWDRQTPAMKAVLRFNNTLFGRLLIGPALGQVLWMRSDIAKIREGDTAIRDGWLWHIPAVAIALAVVAVSQMPLWAYAVAAYIGLAILKIRTFLEHQAHEKARARTVIIEDRGPLAFLFLNNNLHAVHHMHPRVPWYRLPKLYRANPARYLGANGGYRFRSYAQVFGRYFLTAKDPVPHPLWTRKD